MRRACLGLATLVLLLSCSDTSSKPAGSEPSGDLTETVASLAGVNTDAVDVREFSALERSSYALFVVARPSGEQELGVLAVPNESTVEASVAIAPFKDPVRLALVATTDGAKYVLGGLVPPDAYDELTIVDEGGAATSEPVHDGDVLSVSEQRPLQLILSRADTPSVVTSAPLTDDDALPPVSDPSILQQDASMKVRGMIAKIQRGERVRLADSAGGSVGASALSDILADAGAITAVEGLGLSYRITFSSGSQLDVQVYPFGGDLAIVAYQFWYS